MKEYTEVTETYFGTRFRNDDQLSESLQEGECISTDSCSMLRVMMAVPQYPYPVVGGFERQAHELAKTLRERGVQVEVVSGKTQSGQAATEYVDGVLVHRVSWPCRKWLRFIATPVGLVLVLFMKRKTYDVVHLHQSSWFGLFVIVIVKLIGKPILTKLPNVGEFGVPGLLASPFGRLKLSILRWSDAIVAMSQESIDELNSARFPRRRILATPNGIHPQPARLRCVRDDVNECTIVYVGRLAPEKRIADLLTAWSTMIGDIGNVAQLQLWGTGPLESQLKIQSENLGIADSVIFCGYVDSVRVKLEQAHVFVLPSCAEGNSNAILEAMAAGLPIVSTRVGGTPMLVGPHGAQFLVEPGDVNGLASCLKTLIRDRELRHRVGTLMRQRTDEAFDMQSIAGTYATAYVRLQAGQRDRIGELSNPVVVEDRRINA